MKIGSEIAVNKTAILIYICLKGNVILSCYYFIAEMHIIVLPLILPSVISKIV